VVGIAHERGRRRGGGQTMILADRQPTPRARDARP